MGVTINNKGIKLNRSDFMTLLKKMRRYLKDKYQIIKLKYYYINNKK